MTVNMPLREYFRTSFSLIPRRRLRSSLAIASAWHRLRNSHTWQCEFSLNLGGVPVPRISPYLLQGSPGLRDTSAQLDPANVQPRP